MMNQSEATLMPGSNRSGIATISALAGGALWVALVVASLSGNRRLDLFRLLFLLAPLAFVPLGFELTSTPDADGRTPALYRFARLVQLPSALAAAGSFFLPVGTAAGAMAGAWLLFAVLAAGTGLQRIIRRSPGGMEERCIDAALLYLPIGGAWLVAERAGLTPLGFSGLTALLNAIHFHFAGFIAPLAAGMAGRRLAHAAPRLRNIYRIAAAGIIAGPSLVAVGISFSPILEVVSAVMLATCVALAAGLVLRPVARSITDGTARVFLGISATASVAAMLMACLYAVSTFTHSTLISIPQMGMMHGALNALFALAALLAWNRVRPAPVLHP